MDKPSNSEQQAVRVFSAEWCGFCRMVKSYLHSKNIKFTEINIEEDPESAKWLFEHTGQAGIPVTIFGDNDVVVGFDRAGIDEMIKQHKLA